MSAPVNLKWSDHVKHVLSLCYGVLSTLPKIRNLAQPHVKKQLAECLVLSKLQFNDIVCFPLPIYLKKKIQRVQNSAASFVVNHYATEEDVLKLGGWLPTKERTELNLLRTTHHAIYNPSWPEYFKVEKRESKRLLRSNKAPLLVVPLIKGTFEDFISSLFNELPAQTRSCSDLPSYIRQVKDILKQCQQHDNS